MPPRANALKRCSAKGGRGQPQEHPGGETRDGTVAVESGPMCQLASVGPGGPEHKSRGGRAAERHQTEYPTRHSSSARHPLMPKGEGAVR